MINLLLRSRTLRAVLGLFFSNPGSRFYAREIARRTNEPMGALQRQLVSLEKGGLLKGHRKGQRKYYSLNEAYPYTEELRSLILKSIRKKKLEKNLRLILKTLKVKYQPDKVILFGSYAQGNIQPTSDLDLLIVKKDAPRRYWDRIKEIAPLVCDCEVGLDYTVWTTSEWQEALQNNAFVQKEILRGGKVLYDKTA